MFSIILVQLFVIPKQRQTLKTKRHMDTFVKLMLMLKFNFFAFKSTLQKSKAEHIYNGTLIIRAHFVCFEKDTGSAKGLAR